jgi:putative nucleotidyltransferase with HDIG domain
MMEEWMSEVGVLPLQYCMAGVMRAGRDVTAGKNVILRRGAVMTDSDLEAMRKSDITEAPVLLTDESQEFYDDYKLNKPVGQCLAERALGYKKLKRELMRVFIKRSFTLDSFRAITGALIGKARGADKDSIFRCIDGVRAIDEYLYTHSINVALLAHLMLGWLGGGEDEEQRFELVMAALLHDVGKTKIDKKIILKTTVFDAAEMRIIKKHPLYGFEILSDVDGISESVKDAVYSHHEKINGFGYPRGLKGDSIGKFARIVSICDIYDAMMANKVYRTRQSSFHVFDVFMNDKLNGNLDYALVSMFLERISSGFVGKNVTLDNGERGKIIFMNPVDYSRPLVQVGDRVVNTGTDGVTVSDVID